MAQVLSSPAEHARAADRRAWLIVTGAAIVWLVAYRSIQPLAHWLTYGVIGLQPGSHLGESVAFFLYDVPKILLLLSGMIFVISTVRSFFSPERTRALLAGKREGVGNLLAASLGVVTPFCSCSAVPLFIGFVEAGIPLGVTFSFLIAAPMVNEVALVMLFGLFGWQIAALYMAAGLAIAIASGMVIGRLQMERYVEDFVWQIRSGGGAVAATDPTWSQRFALAWQSTREIVGRVWLYVIIGIAVGAGIHGYVPEQAMADIMGREAWWVGSGGSAAGGPALCECRRCDAGYSGADCERRSARNGAGVYDGCRRPESAGDDHSPTGAQAAPDHHLHRHHSGGHCCYRVSVQPGDLSGSCGGKIRVRLEHKTRKMTLALRSTETGTPSLPHPIALSAQPRP
jgi:uncharacterized membrane protein YraQ (UPF0718 family)